MNGARGKLSAASGKRKLSSIKAFFRFLVKRESDRGESRREYQRAEIAETITGFREGRGDGMYAG